MASSGIKESSTASSLFIGVIGLSLSLPDPRVQGREYGSTKTMLLIKSYTLLNVTSQ